MERLERSMWKSSLTSDLGPGLPMQLRDESNSSANDQRSWLDVAEVLPPNSVTGDASVALAKSQKKALQRSLTAPCRVDFGPFEVGFLAAPSGTTPTITPSSDSPRRSTPSTGRLGSGGVAPKVPHDSPSINRFQSFLNAAVGT